MERLHDPWCNVRHRGLIINQKPKRENHHVYQECLQSARKYEAFRETNVIRQKVSTLRYHSR